MCSVFSVCPAADPQPRPTIRQQLDSRSSRPTDIRFRDTRPTPDANQPKPLTGNASVAQETVRQEPRSQGPEGHGRSVLLRVDQGDLPQLRVSTSCGGFPVMCKRTKSRMRETRDDVALRRRRRRPRPRPGQVRPRVSHGVHIGPAPRISILVRFDVSVFSTIPSPTVVSRRVNVTFTPFSRGPARSLYSRLILRFPIPPGVQGRTDFFFSFGPFLIRREYLI